MQISRRKFLGISHGIDPYIEAMSVASQMDDGNAVSSRKSDVPFALSLVCLRVVFESRIGKPQQNRNPTPSLLTKESVYLPHPRSPKPLK